MSSVVVRIAGDDTQLQAALVRAQKGLSQLGGHIRKGANDFVKYGSAITAAGVAITAALVVKQAAAIDATAKLAASLNTSTESVATLQHAAKLGGIDGMEGALTRLNRRLGAAEFGAGAAAVTVKALNLDLDALSKMPVDERVASIADTIRDSGMSFQQAARHLQNLGFEQKEATQLFMQGGDAFRSAKEDAEALGLAFNGIEAAQVEAATTAMGRMADVISGIGNRITIELAPYIEEVANRFTSLSTETGGFKTQIQSMISSALQGFGKFGNVLQGLRVAFKGVQLVAEGFGSAVLNVMNIAMKGVGMLADKMIRDANMIIAGLNKLPKVDIAKIDPFSESAFMKGLDNLAEQSRIRVGEVRGELHDLAMQELPSDKIDQFLADVARRSEETAAQVAAARESMHGFGGLEPEGDDGAELEKQERALDAIRNRYMTEQELLRQHQETMMLIGEEYDVAKFETEEEWRSIREQAEQEHMDRLADIRQKGLSSIEKFQAMSFRAQVANVSSALASMTAGVANENKKMFELNKAAGIANAVVSAYQGIATTLGTYPFPLSAAMAAAQGVAAFAQVNAIRSASFSGGGGAAPSLAGGTPATPVTPVGGGTPQAQQSQTMRVEGLDRNSLFGGDAVETIARGLLDFQKDGGQVVFAG